MDQVHPDVTLVDKSNFLADLAARPWRVPDTMRLRPLGLFVGNGDNAIEVVVAESSSTPTNAVLVAAWKARKGRRAAPVLLVARCAGKATLCGAAGESPPVYRNMDMGQAERLCRKVLEQPDRHAALRLLAQALPSLETALPGLSNEGLVALHELEHGVPRRDDWVDAGRKARIVLGKRDHDLLRSLGFSIQRLDNLTSVLRSNDRRTALAIVLHDRESIESGATRFNGLSPVSYAFKKADDEDLPWIVFTQGSRLRLYATDVNVGVGRRGRTDTYVECQPWLLSGKHLAYLWLLFSAEALGAGGSLGQILDGSLRFAGDLADRLRERIYDRVIPELARGIAHASAGNRSKSADLALIYEMALTALFRLLFIAYAEDRDLLPYRSSEAYRRRSLKQKAQELADAVANGVPIAPGISHWQETDLLWQAVAAGNVEWSVPSYGGGLFSADEGVSEAGAELARIELPNECFETALRHLLVIETPEGTPGPVDFRSLGVREFGTIYEGLLESELAVAETDLALKTRKTEQVYVPAGPRDQPAVIAGEVYLHDRSGARKSSGSYYTKPFAVDHLLDRALEPGLDDHFKRLDQMDDADASEAFFDFRVADIAMGSGHFLIGAIDRMERQMADYLATRALPRVVNELEELSAVALREVGDLGTRTNIEDSQLLRRLIARRCIYGVDLNPLAVQLARLAVWIHTFVPGLPLSFLDRNLIRGNSLVGVGTIDEIRQTFESLSLPLYPIDARKLLGKAEKPLRRLANISDKSLDDVAAARHAAKEVETAIRATSQLCDLIAAGPIGGDESITKVLEENWQSLLVTPSLCGRKVLAAAHDANEQLSSLSALHFPIAFPEVFLRTSPGFDVMLGNPPWQEATIEEHAFWARHYPGLRSLSQRKLEAERVRLRSARPDLVALYDNELAETKQLRQVLVSGNFLGMGTGDPDLYKAFCWRFWRLTRQPGGRMGVVLPRSAMSAKGSALFRKTIFDGAARVDVTMLLNNRRWVFPEIDPRYSIGLAVITRGEPESRSIHLRGPYASLARFQAGTYGEPSSFSSEEVKGWNDSVSLPLLPCDDSLAVFAQLRKSPRLDLNVLGQWRARPDRELDATNQKPLMDLVSKECPEGFWPVYKGESFDLWTPDTGRYYAWADPEPVIDFLLRKRHRARNNRRSAHSEFQESYLLNRNTLPCFRPRVAFRDVTNRTNRRTVIACLLPPQVFITNTGPYLLWPRGDESDQAFLVGVLSSIPLDWYSRRFIELHLNFHVFNPLPIPRPEREDPRWQRVVSLSGRLACPDECFAEWATAVGVGYDSLEADEKEDMIHELDAVVAHLYGLTETHLRHVFETFHVGWDYEPRLTAVLEHYRAWARRK